MKLPTDSADAFRQCLRILGPRYSPDQRRAQVRNAESCIARGEWIAAFDAKDVALLFFPHAPAREAEFLSQMEKAAEARELVPFSTAGLRRLLPSDLASWPQCPPVPKNSPLRYWLPAWMHEKPQHTATPAPVVAESASGGDEWKAKAKARAVEIIERERKRDLYPPQLDVADEIAREFRRDGVMGADGKPLAGETIKRHAMNGISSAQGKRLSTSIRRGK